MPARERLARRAQAVGAGLGQPFESTELVAVELHAIADPLHAVAVIKAAAVPAVEQLASDIGRVEDARFFVFELVHAAAAAAVAQRLPLATVERGERLFPEWNCTVHDKSSLALLIDSDQAGNSEAKSMKSLIIALAGAALVLTSKPSLAQYYGSDGEQFISAVEKRDGNKATELLQNHPTIVDTKNSRGDTGLIIAIRDSDSDWTAFLLNKGADPNTHGENGDTPLIAAAKSSFEDAARWLIGVDAEVDEANKSGETPLIIAVQRGDARLVKLLLEHGADPDRTDSVAGYSARDYANRNSRGREIQKLINDTKPKGASAAK